MEIEQRPTEGLAEFWQDKDGNWHPERRKLADRRSGDDQEAYAGVRKSYRRESDREVLAFIEEMEQVSQDIATRAAETPSSDEDELRRSRQSAASARVHGAD